MTNPMLDMQFNEGDELVVEAISGKYMLAWVSRVTPKQIHVKADASFEYSFWREGGRAVGQQQSVARLRVATVEELSKLKLAIKTRRLRREVGNLAEGVIASASFNQLQRIKTVLEEVTR
jgi:hypothetical protein